MLSVIKSWPLSEVSPTWPTQPFLIQAVNRRGVGDQKQKVASQFNTTRILRCPPSISCPPTWHVGAQFSSHAHLGLARVSRNLEKNLPEAPQAPKFFEICHSCSVTNSGPHLGITSSRHSCSATTGVRLAETEPHSEHGNGLVKK